ncbi:homocysteine S-methyltransferase [Glonium stellatum]|uniref:Homocysteine S-methyltransferase n=1 Tax=Glonium stellatum TaxID=574774 RepID=A0A8E2EXS0_9PEZI|nr:homocysteine S-methyltransferase [Glonium stellatum]
MLIPNPISHLLTQKDTVILDGALATELESRGCDLSNALWSAEVLISNPSLIYQTHLDYYRAGADVAVTASYQATPLGLHKHLGLDEQRSIELIQRSVELANQARHAFSRELEERGVIPVRNLFVAGSVGPYGAFLADGAEYRGDYELPRDEMKAFHRLRIRALVDAGVDILACETLPSFSEIDALLELLRDEFPWIAAWFSCTLRDSEHISDGTHLKLVVEKLDTSDQVAALGINCVPEADVLGALHTLRKLTEKPLVVYPNSGEQWDAKSRNWIGERAQGSHLTEAVKQWHEAGASLIGGCCRTNPQDIKVVKDTAAAWLRKQ